MEEVPGSLVREEIERIYDAATRVREAFAAQGLAAADLPEVLNEIVHRINEVEKSIPGCKPALLEAERLTDEILDVILGLAALDFTKTVNCGFEDSNFNAVAAGLNMLGQELQRSTVSKDYVDNILKSMSDALIVINPDKTLKTVNEFALNLLGYEEAELEGKNATLLFEKEPAFLQGHLVALPAGSGDKQGDVVFLTKNSKPIPMQIKGSVMTDSSGNMAAVVLVARDMREIYRLIASAEAANMRLSDVNASLEIEIQNRKVAEEKLQEAHDNLEAQVQDRTAALSKTNQLLNMEVEERKKAEAETLAREKKYRDIFENTSVAVWEADVTESLAMLAKIRSQTEQEIVKYFEENSQKANEVFGAIKIVDVNSATMTLFEASNKQQMFEELPNTLAQSGLLRVMEALAGFASGQEGFEGEGEFVTLTGKKKTLHMLISLQHKMEDKSDTILINLIDISQQKDLEDQLRQSQKMEAIGRLAGGVAHDFNNLLTVILNYGQMLVDDVSLPEPKHRKVEQIVECAERAAGLTQQLLAFSRKQVMALKILDLNETISRMDKMLRRLLGEDIELINELDPNIGMIKADSSQVEQIILNLAVNARDAMPKGGKLLIETSNFDIDDIYTSYHPNVETGHYVVVTITDTGEGMPEAIKSKIFEPFFTTKGLGKGTGLGLSTVYGNIKQSGGHIWVYSEVDIGTSFKLFFPRLQSADSKPEKEQADYSTTKAETVLIVDDESGVKNLAATALRKLGYKVLEAGSAKEALTMSEQNKGKVDLLLTDVIMPDLNGKALADKLSKLRPDMKVLFMSGYSDKAVSQNGILMPGTRLVQKPFTQKSLSKAVREVLDAKV